MKKNIRLVGIIFLMLLVMICGTGCGEDEKKPNNEAKGNFKILRMLDTLFAFSN